MILQFPTQREILKYNRALPDHLRQCSVVLQFQNHMPRYRSENFYRIRMTGSMLSAGEEEFWMPEVLQEGRIGKQKCLGCGWIMQRVGVLSTVCVNDSCASVGIATINGPRRGVHSVKVEFESFHPSTKGRVTVSFVVGQEWMTVDQDVWLHVTKQKLRKMGFACSDEALPGVVATRLGWLEDRIPTDMIIGCLVVLDRRYSDECLCAVWRTCGQLCDQMGWGLK